MKKKSRFLCVNRVESVCMSRSCRHCLNYRDCAYCINHVINCFDECLHCSGRLLHEDLLRLEDAIDQFLKKYPVGEC